MALALHRAGGRVTICATEFDGPFVESIDRDRTHPTIGQVVPADIEIAGPEGWKDALPEARIVVVAVSSHGVRGTVAAAAPHLAQNAIVAVASKGWDPGSAEPLSTIVRAVLPHHPVVIVAGPSLASELAAGVPTALVCASDDASAAREVASALSSSALRTFVTDDVVGVEVGAAIKNVLAIAIGMCDGVSQMKGATMGNTKAALFSRGLVEMGRLAKAMGGRTETVLGLAGAGDLFVTVLGGRNGRFGRLVGEGVAPEKALEEMGTTVEGYENTRQAAALADRYRLDLPLVRAVHGVLYEGVSPEDAVARIVPGPVEEEL